MAFYQLHREWTPDMTPTDVEIIHPCYIQGIPREIGDIVSVGKQDAIDLAAMKRVVILEKSEA